MIARQVALHQARYCFWLVLGLVVASAALSAPLNPKLVRDLLMSAEVETVPLFGLNFGPYIDGQSPSQQLTLTDEQLLSRLRLLAPYARRVRTFGATHGLENVPRLAAALGMGVVAGAWIGTDTNANEVEVGNLITIGRSGNASLLVVGSEALLRGDVTEDALLGYMARVKAAVPNVPVTYADRHHILLAHPRVLAASDIVFANYYPYWDGISIENAIAAVHGWHKRMIAAAANRPVYVSEAGWPSSGNVQGAAVASAANAQRFFADFVSWARQQRVAYFYFEAFDEAWKATVNFPEESHWGVMSSVGKLKPGFERTLSGKATQDSWSSSLLAGGPGTPTIEFTSVPALGTSDRLFGRVWHVIPTSYNIAVYIRVGGGWWTKPYADARLTTIGADGSWVAQVVSGGFDNQANSMCAYLVPIGYDPPLVLGGTVPATVANNAAAQLCVDRP